MPFLVDSLQLKSFIAIAETGSFGKAARTVSRTQSALSLQIKKLEDQLGCQLFDRGGRKVTLTPEGEIFLGYARQMKQLQWEAFGSQMSKGRSASGRRKISLPTISPTSSLVSANTTLESN
jgi:DNA-binding transcriptional LysR family regulator